MRPNNNAAPQHAMRLSCILLMSATLLWTTSASSMCANKSDLASRDRFRSYGENYGLYNKMQNNNWASADEWAIRAHYSLAYLALDCDTHKLALTYTGEFDFYLGTRTSGPVINRLSNPAIHYRYIFAGHPTDNRYETYIDLGVEHESDGQTVSVATPAEANVAQNAYDLKDRHYFDQISRGANFISLTGRWSLESAAHKRRPIAFIATLRLYTSQDYDVTWGPLANQSERLSKYNVLRLRGQYDANRFGAYEATWTIGSGGTKRQSFDLSWRNYTPEKRSSFSVPLYIRWHHGPLNTLSNYTQRQDSIGIGLQFSTL